MRNVGTFVAQAEEASAAVGHVGTSAETAGKKATISAKGLLKWAGGAMAIYGTVRFLDHAISATEELAKNTYKLQQQTGMDAATASEWIALNKERGLSAQKFSMGMATLSKQMEKARGGDAAAAQQIAEYRKQIDLAAAAGGADAPRQIAKFSSAIDKAQQSSEKARKVLAGLGIPLSDIQKGMTPDVLMRISDAFKAMKNPAERAADAQLLFGRSGKELLPVLAQGREAVQKMLDAQKEQGNYLTEKQVQANLKAIQQQRELSAAFHGLQTQLSLALLPILLKLGKMLIDVASFLRPITSRSWALALVIGSLTGAFVAYKAALIAAWVWQNREMLAAVSFAVEMKALTVATWLWNAAQAAATLATQAWTVAMNLLKIAFITNPIGLIILAVIALGVAFYEAYKHVTFFRNAVNEALHYVLVAAQFVWSWIKKNWPLLVGMLFGPFGIAAGLIYQHFSAVKTFVLGVLDAIRAGIQSLLHWVSRIPKEVGNAVKSIPGVGAAIHVGGAIGGAVGSAFGQYGGSVGRPGSFIVGERGPELVSLPAGALIRPTPDTASSAGHGQDLYVTVPVMLDRKVVAKAVARVTADQLARR
jgi:hypothetical protein